MFKLLVSTMFFLTFLSNSQFVFGQSNAPSTLNSAASDNKKFALSEIRNIHGATGPFAVAGYRIGKRASEELELLKGSFNWDVNHESLMEVKWSCIADGIQAATGASAGKLTLRLTPVQSQKDVQSVISNKKTNEKIVFRLTDSFLQKYLNAPPEQLNEIGQTVLDLPDEQIFTIEIVSPGDKPKSLFERKKTAAPSKN